MMYRGHISTTVKNKYFLLLCFSAALLLTSQAHAAILYGHDNTDLAGGQLYQIDTVAQTVTLVGADASREDSGPDIQMSPDNSTIYLSRASRDDKSLFLIDPATGLNTGTLSLSGFPESTNAATALAFVGSTLYASFHGSFVKDLDGILGTIDLNTGAITTIAQMTGLNRPTGGLKYVARTTIAYDEDRLITTRIAYDSQKKYDSSHVHFTLPFQLTPDMTIELTGGLEETIKVADYFDAAHAKFKLVSAFDPDLFPDGWESSPETLAFTLTLGEGKNMATGKGLIDSWEKKKDVKHWQTYYVKGLKMSRDPADDNNPGDSDNCPDDSNKTEPGECGCGVPEGTCGITDTDCDGVEDSVDICPGNTNGNQADADGDGIGDACDPNTDSDDDGMPDDWETLYGLDSDSADAAADPDADGISNLDEYLGGTDPDVYNGNNEPDAPVLHGPAVSLTPELHTEDFYDPDVGDTHRQTQWQIIMQADDRVVLDIRSSNELTFLSVPKLVLQEDTSYRWRARFYDNHGFASQWSQTTGFITELQSEDTDGNGILDAQEVDTLLDLDGDGTADTDREDIKCVNVQGADGQVGISIEDSAAVVAIEALESMDPNDPQFDGHDKPEDMPFGLIHFKLLVHEAGAEAVVQVHFSEPVPADSKWYKFDPIVDTWLDYSEYAVLSSDGKSITVTIIDGGFGDLDGIANGIIIDPSGIATSSAGNTSADGISGSSSNCFITTAAHRPEGLKPLDFGADSSRPQWAILILLLVSLLICFKQRGLK